MKHSNRHVIFIQTICAYSKKEFLSISLRSIRINYDNYYIIIKYYYKLKLKLKKGKETSLSNYTNFSRSSDETISIEYFPSKQIFVRKPIFKIIKFKAR